MNAPLTLMKPPADSGGQHKVAGLLLDFSGRQTLPVGRDANVGANSSTSQPPLISTENSERNESGFSALELLMVVSMILVLAGFALMQVTRARQVMARENAARQFAAFLEKARIDSLRRHPMSSGQMAQVSLVNATFYTVAIDTNGDNVLDPPRVITLPAGSGLQFNGPLPRTIYFNWRGRTVDAAGNLAVPNFVTISAGASNLSRIELTTAGQTSLDNPPTAAPVANSAAPAPNFRPNTQVP